MAATDRHPRLSVVTMPAASVLLLLAVGLPLAPLPVSGATERPASALLEALPSPPPPLSLVVNDTTGAWVLSLDGQPWAAATTAPALHADGQWLQLRVSASAEHESASTTITYKDISSGLDVLQTSFALSPNRTYATFTQCVLRDLSNTALSPFAKLSKDAIISKFPSFTTTGVADAAIGDNSSTLARGFFAYQGQMVGGMEDGTFYGIWGTHGIPSGTSVGPVVVFAQELGAGAIVFGPARNVMATNTVYNGA